MFFLYVIFCMQAQGLEGWKGGFWNVSLHKNYGKTESLVFFQTHTQSRTHQCFFSSLLNMPILATDACEL